MSFVMNPQHVFWKLGLVATALAQISSENSLLKINIFYLVYTFCVVHVNQTVLALMATLFYINLQEQKPTYFLLFWTRNIHSYFLSSLIAIYTVLYFVVKSYHVL